MKPTDPVKAMKKSGLLLLIPLFIFLSSGFIIYEDSSTDCSDSFMGFWSFTKGESSRFYQIDKDTKASGKLRLLNTEYLERAPVIVLRAGCETNEFKIDKYITNGVMANGYIYYTTITGKGMLQNDTITLKLNYHYSENGRVNTEIWKGVKTTFAGINISDYEK